MGKLLNLTGRRFGRWTVLRQYPRSSKKKAARWYCKCDCGQTKIVIGANLLRGGSTGCHRCGCESAGMKRTLDLAGQTFGRWTVLKPLGRRKGQTYWLCRCECGREREVSAGNLRHGNSRQCRRCLLEKMWATRRTRGGRSRSSEYASWCNLGRRDLLCREWLDFADFYAAIGKRPPGKSLHRPDRSRPYGPDNWCWSSPEENRERLVSRASAASGVPVSRLMGLSRQRLHQILLRARSKCVVCGGETCSRSSMYCERHRLKANEYKRKHHQQEKENANV